MTGVPHASASRMINGNASNHLGVCTNAAAGSRRSWVDLVSATLELRYFEMDVELLFSRQPFVQSDVSRFSFIEPGHRESLANLPTEHRVAWPARLRGKNVVVEAVGAGQRKAKVHYANDLALNLAHQYGQIRVQRASDRASLPTTYVKVYAQRRGGGVNFYKDGYTDPAGFVV